MGVWKWIMGKVTTRGQGIDSQQQTVIKGEGEMCPKCDALTLKVTWIEDLLASRAECSKCGFKKPLYVNRSKCPSCKKNASSIFIYGVGQGTETCVACGTIHKVDGSTGKVL